MNMTECLVEAMRAVQQAEFHNATSDNITSIACTLYIQSSRQQSNGKYKSNGRAKTYNKQTRNVPPNQIIQAGAPCNACGNPLVLSKQGKAYCKCWYN